MAYEVVMSYHLHMPSYFLGTFTEYPYLYEHTVAYTNETELRVVANDLEACEKYRLSLLPPRRRTIYAMSRFEDKSISDISAELNLSHRTVENHLRIGRHEVREFIKQCI